MHSFIHTSVIHATSGRGPCNPSALMVRGLPVARSAAIKKIRTQAADVQVTVEPTEIFQCHPVYSQYQNRAFNETQNNLSK